MKYAVIIEKGPTSYGAYVPDLPGCVAAAETREEVDTLIREAIQLYIEALQEDGLPVPEPHSYELVEAYPSSASDGHRCPHGRARSSAADARSTPTSS